MSKVPPIQSSVDERLTRLERTVFWHNVAWWIVATILVAYMIPPIGGILGLVLIPAVIAGAVVTFIRTVMWLLDRYFSNVGTRS